MKYWENWCWLLEIVNIFQKIKWAKVDFKINSMETLSNSC